MINKFIQWAIKRARHARPIVTFAGEPLFDRYEFLRHDEWPDHLWDQYKEKYPVRPCRLPWWMPFNAFVHHWKLGPNTPESFHDHPRWSVTICLKGQIIERTPWSARLLTPGSVVVRTRKAIHAFEVPEGSAEPWTLFIVGRRKYRQNSYVVTAR